MSEPTDPKTTTPPDGGRTVTPRAVAAAAGLIAAALQQAIPHIATAAAASEQVAGVLFDPELAEEIAAAAREQTAAEARAELDELRDRLAELTGTAQPCATAGCGMSDEQLDISDPTVWGWILIHVHGVDGPRRWWCSPPCATAAIQRAGAELAAADRQDETGGDR